MYYFVNYLLHDCGMVGLMKKVEMQHPKLYLSAMKNKKSQIEFTYISNRFSSRGNLKEQSVILEGIDINTSVESTLIHLNKIELKKLDVFISRQKKVISSYQSKSKLEKFKVVSDSLQLLINLRSRFNNWFDEMECIA